jgi:hypothetical protein
MPIVGLPDIAKVISHKPLRNCDQAIHINPRLAIAYLNRATARKTLGDATGALVELLCLNCAAF